MTFNWQGQIYDTSNMTHFETGNPAMPVVYVGTLGEVFMFEIERMEGIEVRRAKPAEAAALAERLGFTHLINVQKDMADANADTRSKDHALIVEDDCMARHALSRLLNRSGYEIVCAATIAEAEIKIKKRPKWLILDLQLPDGYGKTLLEWVRAENLPIKVAITTGETDPVALSAVCDLRPEVIFHKPLNIPEVMRWMDAA